MLDIGQAGGGRAADIARGEPVGEEEGEQGSGWSDAGDSLGVEGGVSNPKIFRCLSACSCPLSGEEPEPGSLAVRKGVELRKDVGRGNAPPPLAKAQPVPSPVCVCSIPRNTVKEDESCKDKKRGHGVAYHP